MVTTTSPTCTHNGLTYSLWPPHLLTLATSSSHTHYGHLHPHLLTMATSLPSHYSEPQQAPNKESAFHADLQSSIKADPPSPVSAHPMLCILHEPLDFLLPLLPANQGSVGADMDVQGALLHHSRGSAKVPAMCELGQSGAGAGGPQAAEDMEAHHHGGVFKMAVES